MRPRSPLKSLPPPVQFNSPHSYLQTTAQYHRYGFITLPRSIYVPSATQSPCRILAAAAPTLSTSPSAIALYPIVRWEHNQRTKTFAFYWLPTSYQYALSFPSSDHSIFQYLMVAPVNSPLSPYVCASTTKVVQFPGGPTFGIPVQKAMRHKYSLLRPITSIPI